ncbi:MAG: LssY C-terminal domain-containing protein [Parcubacteria group bacterium]|nr:LssY C-terminal domain-containing protein [Parcubacteria group bacterium]
MTLIQRLLERLAIALLGLAAIWFIVTQVFDRLEDQLPWFLALALTYFIAAYVVLPPVIHLSGRLLRHGHIPRFTRSGDGLSAEPINMILLGSERALRAAFAAANWHTADPLNTTTSWKMFQTFLANRPYLTAPFRSFYLFGRKQDVGFQQPIGKSPRKRHHIRFWGANVDPAADLADGRYWTTKHKLDQTKPIMWMGSGVKDIGLGLTRFSYQITHAVDKNVDEERDYILASLQSAGWIKEAHYVRSGEFVIGKYVSDGRILVAQLKEG